MVQACEEKSAGCMRDKGELVKAIVIKILEYPPGGFDFVVTTSNFHSCVFEQDVVFATYRLLCQE